MLLVHQVYPGDVWSQKTELFDEWILSWNVQRPAIGKYVFFVRFKTSCWSSWIAYAEWSSSSQSTFEAFCPHSGVKAYQDTVEATSVEAGAFEVTVHALDGAPDTQPIHLFVNITKKSLIQQATFRHPFCISLPVPPLSQQLCDHSEHARMCSPVATTSFIRYLNRTPLDPLLFAHQARDTHWNIYGNWILNCAQVHVELSQSHYCWVEHLTSFDEILSSLQQNIPVVVSIQGPLKGSALPYKDGHLVLIHGYDSVTKEVLCMDPAFPTHDLTLTRYEISSFLTAWHRRLNIAYRSVAGDFVPCTPTKGASSSGHLV